MDREVFLLGFTDTGWWLIWNLDSSVTAQGMKNHSKAEICSGDQSRILNHFIRSYFNSWNKDYSRRIRVSVCKTWMGSKSKNKKTYSCPVKWYCNTLPHYHIGNKVCEWRKNWALCDGKDPYPLILQRGPHLQDLLTSENIKWTNKSSVMLYRFISC